MDEKVIELLKREKRKRECRRDANTFIEYAFHDPISQSAFKQSAIHTDMQKLIDMNDRVLIMTPRFSGKCLSPNTEFINAETGEKILAKDLKVGMKVLSIDDNMKLSSTKVTAVEVMPARDIYEVVLRDGSRIEVTGNHPFLCYGEWTVAADLREGMRVAVWNDRVKWVKVKSVKVVKNDISYGISCSPYPWFITNGIITHNTSQIIARVIWELGRNHNLRIKIVCSTNDLAMKRVTEIREHLMRNERVHEIFPDLKESGTSTDWSKTSITVERDIIDKDPSLEAAGILTSGVGGRANLLFFDDVVDYRNSIQNPALKEVVKRSYIDVWLPLLDPKGKIVYICTPWTNDDLSMELLSTEEYKVLKRGVGQDFESFWPERWTKEELVRKFKEMGAQAFNRAFRLIPQSEHESSFPPEILRRVFKPLEAKGKYEGWITVGGVDPGMGEKGRTYTVVLTVAYDPVSRQRVVLNLRRGKFSSPETAAVIASEYQKYKHSVVGVENNAYQNALISWMSSYGYSGIPIEPIQTQSSRNYIRILAQTLAIEMEQGLWNIFTEEHDITCKCDWCSLKKELYDYPFGSHNDIVSALCIASYFVKNMDQEMLNGDYESW